MSIAIQLSRNIAATGLGLIVRVVLAFLVIPVLTAHLGPEKYGLWAIIFQILTYLGLADIGIDKAIARQVARQSANPSWSGISGLVASALPLTLLLGTLPIGLALVLGQHFLSMLEISVPTLIYQSATALILVSIYVGVRTVLLPITVIPVGMQRQDVVSRWDILEEIGRAVLLLILVTNWPTLPVLAAGVLGIGLVRQLGMTWHTKHLYPELQLIPRQVAPANLKPLLSYSGVTLGVTVGWMILFNSDAILLGMLGSVAAAGIYMPAVQLMLYLRHIVNIVGVPLTPMVARLEGLGQREKIADWYGRWSRAISFLSFASAISVSLYAPHFVRLWLPEEFAAAGSAMAILAVGNAFFMPSIIGNAVLFGTAKHRYLLWIVLAEVIVRVGLALFLIPRSGVAGLAMATTASQIALYSFVFPALVCRSIGVNLWTVFPRLITGSFWGALISFPLGLALLSLMAPDNWFIFFLHVAVITAAFAAALWRLVMSADDREAIRSSFRRTPGNSQ